MSILVISTKKNNIIGDVNCHNKKGKHLSNVRLKFSVLRLATK